MRYAEYLSASVPVSKPGIYMPLLMPVYGRLATRINQILTPWSLVLLGKLMVPHLAMKFTAFYENRMFITMSTRDHLLPMLSQINPAQALNHIS
jgi:hypothetical protein